MEMTEEHSNFLDRLRQSGRTNMFGAAPYLEKKFGVTRKEAHEIMSQWMESYR